MKTTTVALSFGLLSILAGCATRERVVVREPVRPVVVVREPAPAVIVAPAPVVQERVIVRP